jgi:hypothetical protein
MLRHDEPRPPADPPCRPGGALVPDLLTMAGVAWGLGTPFLWFHAMMLRATWFGEVPEPSELRASDWLLGAALACGFVGPLAGLVLALVTRRRAAAVLLTVALCLSTAGGVATGVVARDSSRADHRNPSGPTVEQPRACQELSGGDSTCPGG